jgi:MerR family transcriptional regulator, redox-sensitive transcriptional activator SoxR
VSLKSRAGPAAPSETSELLTIGEVSRRSGVASSALRFYEQRGLIDSRRAGSGHRRYPRSVLRRIAFIVFAQRVGLTLDEIGEELSKLPPDRAPTRRDWSRLSSGWSSRCQLANPGDRAASRGPGPRYWIDGRSRGGSSI